MLTSGWWKLQTKPLKIFLSTLELLTCKLLYSKPVLQPCLLKQLNACYGKYTNSVSIWKFGSRELKKTKQNSPGANNSLTSKIRNCYFIFPADVRSCHFKALLQNNVCILICQRALQSATGGFTICSTHGKKRAPIFLSPFFCKDDAINVHSQSSAAGIQDFLGRPELFPTDRRPKYVSVSKLEAFKEK